MSKLTRLYTLNMCYLLCFLHLSETENYILMMLSNQSVILVNYYDLVSYLKATPGFLLSNSNNKPQFIYSYTTKFTIRGPKQNVKKWSFDNFVH